MKLRSLTLRLSLTACALSTLILPAGLSADVARDTLDAQVVAWAGEGPHRAYVVVDFDDSSTDSAEFLFAVRFTSDSITGLQALETLAAETAFLYEDFSGYPNRIAFPYMGVLYDGYNAWPDKWWSYWHSADLGATWEMALIVASGRVLRDGDMDGWIHTLDLDWPPTMAPNGPRMIADFDQDGLADALETTDPALLGAPDSTWTHRYLPDSDGDGLLDGQEDTFGRASTTATLALTHPRHWDTDGDGFGDGMEVLILGTDPLDPSAPDPADLEYFDSNGDGVPDALKIALGLDPQSCDSDGDGYCDAYEIVMGTDPADPDSRPSLGDIDGSGAASNVDAALLLSMLVGHVTEGGNWANADVTADGMINNLDAMALFYWNLGRIPTLPHRL